jgi:predicted nuclease of predicted toxin-antitoxin system
LNLLFDQNISFRITKLLSETFPGCKHVSDVGMRNATDLEIWRYGKENRFCIVTFDSDFIDFSTLMGHPPKLIILRTGNRRTAKIADMLKLKKAAIDNFLNDRSGLIASCLEVIE